MSHRGFEEYVTIETEYQFEIWVDAKDEEINQCLLFPN